VAAGAKSATFTAAAGTIVSNQTASVTATMSGVSKSATLNLLGGPTLSSLNCSPTTLTSGESSTCTVALAMAAPAGGSSVSLTHYSSLITTPVSVTVPAGFTSATFIATVGTVTDTRDTRVTATLNGTSRSVVFDVVDTAP
jgi:hypothetical protein